MKNIVLYITVLFLLFALQLKGQTDTLQVDSIQPYQRKIKDAKLLLEFDSRQSFVLGQRTKMNGLKLGVEIKEKYRFGFGFYNMREPINTGVRFLEGISYNTYIKLDYQTIFGEYIFYKDFKHTASAVFSIGVGKGEVRLKNDEFKKDIIESTPTVPVFATNVSFYYNPIPWIGVGGGVGLRRVISGDEKFKKVFNSPIYIIKIKLILGSLYKCLFKRKEIKAEKAEYERQKAERIQRRKDKRLAKINDNGSVLRD